MKAIVCNAFGPPESLSVETLPPPSPGPGQVLVQTHAIGLNFTDLLAIEGRSQLKRQFPMIPGVEAAGIVAAIGPGVRRLIPGQRVLGTKTQGTYAEAVIFEEDEVVPIPDAMDMQSAASFFIAAQTMRYALEDRARLVAGEILLVLGAGGGAGLAAVEIGKALGARVVAAASSDEKLALAKARGADALVRYERGPLVLAAQKQFTADLLAEAGRSAPRHLAIGEINSLRADAGYHVIMDGNGGSYAEPALRALGWQGRYLSVGFAAGMAKVALGPLLFKNADIMGIQPTDDDERMPGRNLDKMEKLFRWYREGLLRPHVSAVFPLEQAARALRLLADRQATGRVVLATSYAR